MVVKDVLGYRFQFTKNKLDKAIEKLTYKLYYISNINCSKTIKLHRYLRRKTYIITLKI